MSNSLLAVTGMAGAGKDFMVEKANHDARARVENWGTLLGYELSAHRDEMMDITPPAQIRRAQFEVCRGLIRVQPAIVTCHTIRPEGPKGEYTYDLELEQLFDPKCYVFVSAPAALIHERVRRRNRASSRKVIEMSAGEIEEIQEIKLAAVEEVASLLPTDFLRIHNDGTDTEQKVEILRNKIASLGVSCE